MIYTIAHLKAGNTNLDIMAKGNQYMIWLSEADTFAKRTFNTIDEAYAKFTEMAGYMVKGLYSVEDRAKLLEA